jgi:hypothetical protein
VWCSHFSNTGEVLITDEFKNKSKHPQVLQAVHLVSPRNVTVVAEYVRDPSVSGAGIVISPFPPTDSATREVWATRSDAVGAVVEPGKYTEVVVELRLAPLESAASVGRIQISYKDATDGAAYTSNGDVKYVLEPQGTACKLRP